MNLSISLRKHSVNGIQQNSNNKPNWSVGVQTTNSELSLIKEEEKTLSSNKQQFISTFISSDWE